MSGRGRGRALTVGLVAMCGWLLHAAGSSHSGALSRFEYSQVHMGMPVRIVLYAPSDTEARAAAANAFARIAALDADMSDYRPDSTLNEIARRAPAPVRVSADMIDVVSRALEIARATEGAFDPTVGPVVSLWRDARKSGRPPDRAALAEARHRTGWSRVKADRDRQTVRLDAGMTLDLGAIAKGYILRAALDSLCDDGLTRAMIEAGGDLVTGAAPPGRDGWTIELPRAAALPPPFVARASRLHDAAMATSGPDAQFVEIGGVRYSHVVDPRTGHALTSGGTAHVMAADAATADALATAATVMGAAGLPALRAAFPEADIELLQDPQAPFVLKGDRSTYEWIQLFNGRNLDGWTPKFAKHPLGVNLHDTFRVADGILQVRYDKWEGFAGEFGHLFYREPFSHYLLAAEYRFTGEQLAAAQKSAGWAVRNNGFMVHSQDPKTMVLDQDFPISIEVQMLGGAGTGTRRTTANLCTPGTHVVMNGQLRTPHCTNSTAKTYDGDVWVRIEVLVLGDELIRHIIDGETVLEYTRPQIGGGNASPTDPAVKVDGTPLTRGFIAIQSETAPTDFRKIELVNLTGCGDPKARNYKAYVVNHDAGMCR
jgi:thiamine biosynthesis lipoprotein ApbE